MSSTMKAFVVGKDHTATVKDHPRPSPGKGEVLVKVSLITTNPTDAKHLASRSEEGKILGCDFAGTIAELGEPSEKPNAYKFAVGDRVAGFVHGGYYNDRGSFAEYLKTDVVSLMKIPDNTSDETASSVGINGETAALGLFYRLGLPKPKPGPLPEITSSSPKILVWSGASGVGIYAVQLARAAGAYVITTASPKHHDLLKSMGAQETYDYRETDLPAKIKEKHPDLALGYDCISENGTTDLVVNSLGSSGGEVIILLPVKGAQEIRSDVKVTHILVYTVLGRPFSYGRAEFSAEVVTKDQSDMTEFLNGTGLFYQLFDAGSIKGPTNFKRFEGGLQSGVQKAIDYYNSGAVSGEKLVVPFV